MTLARETRTGTAPHPAAPNVVQNGEARLPISRHFTVPEIDPYDEITWEIRSAVIAGSDGVPVFEQPECEQPACWSQNATHPVAPKPSRAPAKPRDGHGREHPVHQLSDQVLDPVPG